MTPEEAIRTARPDMNEETVSAILDAAAIAGMNADTFVLLNAAPGWRTAEQLYATLAKACRDLSAALTAVKAVENLNQELEAQSGREAKAIVAALPGLTEFADCSAAWQRSKRDLAPDLAGRPQDVALDILIQGLLTAWEIQGGLTPDAWKDAKTGDYRGAFWSFCRAVAAEHVETFGAKVADGALFSRVERSIRAWRKTANASEENTDCSV